MTPTEQAYPFNRYIVKSVPRQRGPLMQHIKAWLAEAPEEKLRKLPQMLRASQLNSVAEKLEKSLQEIEQKSPGCNLKLWATIRLISPWYMLGPTS